MDQYENKILFLVYTSFHAPFISHTKVHFVVPSVEFPKPETVNPLDPRESSRELLTGF